MVSGDYAVVGTTLQIVGEELCEAFDIRSGAKVLDVAAGNGNGSLAAARRWCDVVATDYVPALLDRARERTGSERLTIEFREADAEALPFPDRSFDVVRAAAELVRVCRHGGKIGLADWTPEGFIGQLFKTIVQAGVIDRIIPIPGSEAMRCAESSPAGKAFSSASPPARCLPARCASVRRQRRVRTSSACCPIPASAI
jgi:SAM-dependent methyltransferase